MNRFESTALGIAAGAAAAGYLGAWKLALGSLVAGAISFAFRRYVVPRLVG